MKKLVNVVECPKKAYYQEKLKEDSLKLKPVAFKKCMREMLKAEGFTYAVTEKNIIKHYFKEYLDCCVMEKEKEESLAVLTKKFSRMYDYFFMEGYRLNDVCVYVDEIIDDLHDIHNTVYFDIVFEKNVRGEKVLFPCIIREGKPSYAQNNLGKTGMFNCLKAYCYWMAAKKKWPNAIIEFTEIGLQRRDEKSEWDILTAKEFSEKSNMVSGFFPAEVESELSDRLKQVLKTDWRKDLIDETTDKSKCDRCSYNSLCKYKPCKNEIKKHKPDPKVGVDFKFTDAQQKFIDDHEGYIRTIASAGSGKTTCIINRVVSILKEGKSDISDMLMITFTEKGVAEMKSKLSFWLNQKGFHTSLNDFNIYTFNGFGNRIIKENYGLLGFTSEPTLIDSLQSMDIVREVLDESKSKVSSLNYRNPLLKMFRAEGAVHKTFKFFNELKKNNVETFADMKAKNVQCNSDTDSKIMLDMYHAYNKKMIEKNVVDYDDQLRLTLRLLKQYPEVAKHYNFRHILVDEAQDTSSEQFDLLDILVDVNGVDSFVVCGDDAQAIYGFRGVDMQYLLDFKKRHPETKDYMLMDNFRSTTEIIAMADNIISLNTCNIKKQMIGHKHGKKPFIITNVAKLTAAARTTWEAEAIFDDIVNNIDNGNVEPKDMAVIARTKQELIELSELLNDKHIPNIVAFPEFYIDSVEVMAIKGLLGMLVGKPEILGIANYLQVFKNEEFTNAFDISNLCETENAVMSEKVALMSEDDKVLFFNETVNTMLDVTSVRSLLQLFEEKELLTLEDKYEYLRRLFLYKGDDSYNVFEENMNAIVLTTAHSAKGREWKYVAIMMGKMLPDNTIYKNNMFERDFRKYQGGVYGISDEDRKEMEEDTRLLFVAVTRAKDYLTIMY